MEKLIEALEQFAPLSGEIWEAISKIITFKNLPKGTCILEEGKTCRYLGFVEKGLVRSYYYKNGKDITTSFILEMDPCLSMSSFITQTPSYEYLELLEDSSMCFVHYKQLQELYIRFPQLNLIGRLITEKYFMDLEERTILLQFSSSKERYQRLMDKRPEIILRAPLQHIASFLGMTKENLSRIRRL